MIKFLRNIVSLLITFYFILLRFMDLIVIARLIQILTDLTL